MIERPKRREVLYDLVKQAGFDVTAWHHTAQGIEVARPRSNPNFCYRWAFREEGKTLLCIWHEKIGEDADGLFYEGSMLAYANRLRAAARDVSNEKRARGRARRRVANADLAVKALKATVESSDPVRCVVVARASENERTGFLDESVAAFRMLDPEPWHVEKYDDATGDYRLRRGAPKSLVQLVLADGVAVEGRCVIDQFCGSGRSPEYTFNGKAYKRLKSVRDHVLTRSRGLCEFPGCGQQGFLTVGGGHYLETHHAIPLCEGGADSPSNVIALCANHHRQAHFAVERDNLRVAIHAAIEAAEAGLKS